MINDRGKPGAGGPGDTNEATKDLDTSCYISTANEEEFLRVYRDLWFATRQMQKRCRAMTARVMAIDKAE